MSAGPHSTSYFPQISLYFEQNYGSTTDPGKYTAVVKSSAHERNESLFVSLLYPINIILDIPISQQEQQHTQSNPQSMKQKTFRVDFTFIGDISSLPGIIRIISFSSAIGLTGYIIYKRIRSRKNRMQNMPTKKR